jgi:hypothetical protein
MNPNPVEMDAVKRKAPLTLGIPSDLVFDDEPLEHLLYGAEPIAPTPASVVELWERRLDRSEACARALAAVLARNPDLSGQIRDLDGVEQCLRLALESKPRTAAADLAAYRAALDQLLELKRQRTQTQINPSVVPTAEICLGR